MLSAEFSATLMAQTNFSETDWRWTILFIGIGAILLSIGLLATGIFLFRKQTRDRMLLYFGIFVILYAVRVFLREPTILSVFGIPPAIAGHIIRTITYTIALPILVLFLEVLQTRWRRVVIWTVAVQLAFAVVAVPLDYLGIALRALDVTNSILVLASWVLLIALLFFLRPPGRLPRDLRAVAAGIGVLGLFVLQANLAFLFLKPGRDLEPLGFLFFVGTLGYLVTHRVFAREERLLAIQKELEIAEQIQTSILPRQAPQFPNLEIAARYLPMSAVAGDFYDFLSPEAGRLGVLVADVTGHGVPAALIASMLKVAFAGQKENAREPERVLEGLNQALCGKFESHFVTAAYLYADLDKRIIRYAGAGHPPLLYCGRSDGRARTIEQNGFFLGMFPEAVYSSIELPLHPGDRYLLYTDGLPESKNSEGEEFGLARCQQFLEAHAQLGATELIDELLRQVSLWTGHASGTAPEDDMTLVILDYSGQG